MTDIGIVIVNYNVRHFLVQCLHSIRQSTTHQLNIEVWVVDNASVDGSCALLKSDFPEVHLIENTENVGFSKANNQAIERINAKYVLLLNPDTILEADTLQKCWDYMEERKEAGALGVRMIDGNGVFLPESKRAIPNLWNSFCKLTYLSKLFPKSRLFSGYNLGYIPEFETADIEVLCGAFMFIRGETLAKTGGLDERFFMYGEDIDLSYRILSTGSKVVYFPESTIIHFKGESTKKASLQYVKTFYGAMSLYVNKHYSGQKSQVFRWFILTAIQIRAVLSIIGKYMTTLFRMTIDAVLIFALLQGIKSLWAFYYFGDTNYYENTAIHLNILIYSVLWVISIWFFGRYDKKVSHQRLIYGVLTGSVFILMVYALETELYRTSRALILLGSIAVLLYVLLSKWLFLLFSGTSKQEKSVVIVAYQKEAEKIKEMVSSQSKDKMFFYVVAPDQDEASAYYTNTLPNLEKTIHDLKVNELIFSSIDISMKDIMENMTKLSRFVDFKIAGEEGLGIIGKKVPGKNLYHLDAHFPLDDGFWRRVKWLTDVAISLLSIVLIPVIFILNVGKKQAISNIFLVLIQKKTWVGYGGDIQDYTFLPPLSKAVIRYPLSKSYVVYTEPFFRDKNIEYAQNYSPFTDVWVFITNLNNLYGK